MGYIDLHTHSTASDGSFTPTMLVEEAIKKELTAFALTDHDTVSGIEEALQAAKGTSVQVIPGIEVSTSFSPEDSMRTKDIHILGLNIDFQNVHFLSLLQNFRDSRALRNVKMIEKLQMARLSVSLEALKEAFPDSICTRAHLARYLLDTKQVHSLEEAFQRYLGDHAPCFVPREKVTPFQAISMIHEGGGKAVLAHPLLYHLGDEHLETLVRRLAHSGLDGIEAIYSKNKGMDEAKVRMLAKNNGLFITGGSDFHGANSPGISLGTGTGNLKVPSEILHSLLSLS